MRKKASNIAIIGIAGRYPKASSPAALWNHIVQDTEMSSSCLKGSEPSFVNRYFGVEGIARFDHKRFRFTPQEAVLTDPQHRLLLTCALEALLDAGYPQEPEGQKCGVFATTSLSSYLLNVLLTSEHYRAGEINYPILIGNDKDFIATKVAYKLNLTGPALTIQSACSSSLVALHHACESLLRYECDLTVVGGVSLSIPQEIGYVYKQDGILSSDGYCRPFDERASGTIKGNGCSVVILKRLDEAVCDGDKIYAVIRGTAINNDGANKIGYTAPSISGQSGVIQKALASAQIEPDEIDYIETHGTATKLGDLIELTALAEVFGGCGKKIPLGSLKANLGHLDVAAGLTSVIKLIYMLHSQTVPKIRHFEKLNPELTALGDHFDFPTETEGREIVHCGVSSFGIGGTNAHVILSRYAKSRTCEEGPRCWARPLEEQEFWVEASAKTLDEPKGVVLDEVIDIWRKALGENALSADSNYEDLGGDSLTAIDIIEKINERFRVHLNTSTFQKHLTPNELTKWIERQKGTQTPSAFVALKKAKGTTKSAFLVHPAGGTTFCYHALCQHIQGDYNLFAIDLPEIYAPYESMEKLASFYLEEIRKIQPRGPYIIGGYSFGGNLCYEIAAQLAAQNERVSKIILFDSHTPEAYTSLQGDAIDYKEAFGQIMAAIDQKDLFSDEALRFFYDKWIFSHKLLKNHHPVSFLSCDVTLFTAQEREESTILDRLRIADLDKRLWEDRVRGRFKAIEVAGNHYSMFDRNHICELSHHFDKEML